MRYGECTETVSSQSPYETPITALQSTVCSRQVDVSRKDLGDVEAHILAALTSSKMVSLDLRRNAFTAEGPRSAEAVKHPECRAESY